MSDNIYRALMGDSAPFLGMANISYYDRMLRGIIVAVHYDPMSETLGENGKHILNQQSYRTVDVELMEGKPYKLKNVHIPELVSYLGYGLNYLPSNGDIVFVGFDSNNSPQIINIVARCSAYEHGALEDSTKLPLLNEYGDPIIDKVITKSIRPTPIRYIVPGEISLTSANMNSEIYLDKYGSTKIISREPIYAENVKDDILFENGLQCGKRLWEISVGQDIYDESTKLTKQSSLGNNVQFQVLGHQNGCKVDFDSEGNIEVTNNGNNMQMQVNGDFIVTTSTGNSISLTDGIIKVADKNGNSITMNSKGIHLGDNADFSAVLGESLNTLLQSMITIFNAHTHMYSPGSGHPTPTATTLTPMTISDILSKTIKLKQ